MDRDNIIRAYFEMGLEYNNILAVMAERHNIVVSLRHLKRILKGMNLSRRNNYTDINNIVNFIKDQLSSSGSLHGYR